MSTVGTGRLALGVGVAAGLAVAGSAAVTAGRRSRLIRELPRELRHPLLYLPLDMGSPAAVKISRRLPVTRTGVVDGVVVSLVRVPGPAGRPEVPCYRYQPAGAGASRPGLLYLHGGGFVVGAAESDHHVCSRFAAELGIVVLSVDYRLAPEHPFPAALDDAYAALAWLHRSARSLGVDPQRIGICGVSAGGGLAASLIQLAHDRAEYPVCFQSLVYPMLDDRTVNRPAPAAPAGTFLWTPTSNRYGWRAYLGPDAGGSEVPQYAAAARRSDLRGLPPAWIGVGDLDLFHAEDLDYARRLRAAGVPCELVLVPGMYHGADAVLLDRSAVTKQFRAEILAGLRAGLGLG